MRPVVSTAMLLGLAACGGAPDDVTRTLALEPCRIAGTDRVAQCGAVPRPVDPAAPDGDTIDVRVVVFPAREPSRRHPLYFFAGGPGQAASEAFGPIIGGFDDVGRDRDLVLVDQRGTGSSAPLDCEPPHEQSLAEQLAGRTDTALLSKCLADFEHDPRLFVTTIAADDLDAVRVALGHGTIDLIGGSYGTRAAMVYARAHGDHVGKIVLDGVAPVDMALPASFGVDAQAVLDATFADCAAEPTCAAAFPDAKRAFERWMTELARAPTRVELAHPRTGERVEFDLGAREVGLLLRGVLYVPALTSILPLTLARARTGDVAPLVAQALLLGDSTGEGLSHGMFLSVVCAEDVPYIDERALAPNDGTFLGRGYVDVLREACAMWPRAELAPGYRDPVVLPHDVLVLSGALDPVTPPRWGEYALAHLPAGRHVIVAGAGHGTMAMPCVTSMIHAFLDGADTLEVGCAAASERPPFFIDVAGPPP